MDLRPKVGWLHVREPVLHDEPLVLRFGQHDETETLRPFVTMGLIAGTPQWWDPRGGLEDARGAEGCLERGNAALTLGASRREFPLGTLVESHR